MKTISELQQEIRRMQVELHNIYGRLTEVNEELLNYKDSGIIASNYKRIYEIAETMPIIEHPIINYGYAVKNNYFAILILIATCEDSINDEQLLFLQRMIMADSQRTAIDLYMAGIGSINSENVIFNIHESIKEKLARQLLLDMLIIENLSRVKTSKIFEIIANISTFLGLRNETIMYISCMAAAILKQNLEGMKSKLNEYSLDYATVFEYYLKEIPGWDRFLHLLEEQRNALEGRLTSVLKVKALNRKIENGFLGAELSTKEEYGENCCYYYE